MSYKSHAMCEFQGNGGSFGSRSVTTTMVKAMGKDDADKRELTAH